MAKNRPNPRDTLADNVRRLMELRGWTQAEMAKHASVSQKTVSNILNRSKDTQLSMIDRIAASFGLNLWHLIIPGLTDELLSSKSLETLLGGYLTASPEGREFIDALVKRESSRRDSSSHN